MSFTVDYLKHNKRRLAERQRKHLHSAATRDIRVASGPRALTPGFQNLGEALIRQMRIAGEFMDQLDVGEPRRVYDPSTLISAHAVRWCGSVPVGHVVSSIDSPPLMSSAASHIGANRVTPLTPTLTQPCLLLQQAGDRRNRRRWCRSRGWPSRARSPTTFTSRRTGNDTRMVSLECNQREP
jgi:hypothetical protein